MRGWNVLGPPAGASIGAIARRARQRVLTRDDRRGRPRRGVGHLDQHRQPASRRPVRRRAGRAQPRGELRGQGEGTRRRRAADRRCGCRDRRRRRIADRARRGAARGRGGDLRVDLPHRRAPAAAVRDHRHERQDVRRLPAARHPRPARARRRSQHDRGAPHRRPRRAQFAHDARGHRDARHARPDARERGARGHDRGQRAGTDLEPRRRARVRRRVVPEPQPRPPRRLRRHGRVLRGEAAAVRPRARQARRRLARQRMGTAGRRGRRIPVTTIASTPGVERGVDDRVPRRIGGWLVLRAPRPRRPRAHDLGARTRPAHGGERRARDRHARRGRIRARGHRPRARPGRRHPGVPARSHRADPARRRAGGLRRLRPQPRRVRDHARGDPPVHDGPPDHGVRRGRRPRRHEARRDGPDRLAARRRPRHHRLQPAHRGPGRDPRDPDRGRRHGRRSSQSSTRCRPRPRPIRTAVGLAREGDSILWAGPGHEDYIEIGGAEAPFNAREEAHAALREAGWA